MNNLGRHLFLNHEIQSVGDFMSRLLIVTVSCLVILFSVSDFAFAGAHYSSGGEGLKVATLPPPGFYWRVYNTFYNADSMRNNNGNEIESDFDLSVFAFTNRFIWSSDIKILGANLIMDVIIPTIYTDIRMRNAGPASFGDTAFGVGDICIEPFLLAWHGDRYDAAVAAALFLPTGDFDKNQPASPGKGFWTVMLSGGGTLYFDEARTWHGSVLARYEIHTQQEGTRQTHGNDFSFEWGIGKSVTETVDVGISGYSHWQVTEDSGRNADNYRESVHAIGPEISIAVPEWSMGITLRSQFEFAARNKPQGNTTNLVLTYAF